MIKVYGISASRALRPLWLLEEIGLEYQHYPIDFRQSEISAPDYLSINPNGRIPTLVDDDLILFESMAINLYLAKKYGGNLYPKNDADIARSTMWSFWVMSEVENSLLMVLLNTRILPEAERQPDQVESHRALLKKPFDVLDRALADRTYLLGAEFTVADLNVASVLSWCHATRLRLDSWPTLKGWLKRCVDRPAFKTAMRK